MPAGESQDRHIQDLRLFAINCLMLRHLALAMLLLALPARAETLRLAIEDGYAPYVDLKAPNGGMAVEIAREAFRRAGHAVELVQVPWKRGYELVRQGEVFGTLPWAETPERVADHHASAALFDATDYFFSRRDWPREVAAADDLAGLRLCRPLAYGLFHYRALIDAGRVRHEMPSDMKQCFRMLAAGRVDLVWAERNEGLAAAAETPGGTGAVRRQPLVALEVSMHLLASRVAPRTPAVLAAFNRSLAAMRADGVTQAIIDRDLAEFERRLAAAR
jgi:polar amino acid transport system substrate-binding protein